MLSLIPLQLVALAIGFRYVFGHTGTAQLAGWAIVVGSLMTLIAFSVAIWRERN